MNFSGKFVNNKELAMISVSNHEFVELHSHQAPTQCKTHFVFTDIDIDLDLPEISSQKYQLKNGNAIGAYKKDSSNTSMASISQQNKGKRIVAIVSILMGLLLLGAGMKLFINILFVHKSDVVYFCFCYLRNTSWITIKKFFIIGS